MLCFPPRRQTVEVMLLRILFTLVSIAVASTCAPQGALAQSRAAPLAAPQQPIAPEKNPPGDIPDNQAFVEYSSPLGFSIKVPEGWARRDQANEVSFSDKYNEVRVVVSPQATPPTAASLRTSEIAALEKSPNGVRVASVKDMALPAGSAVVVAYGSNSELNPVTNKAIRLDNARYYYWKGGMLATLTLSSPAGADNADQWQFMAKSFAWRR